MKLWLSFWVPWRVSVETFNAILSLAPSYKAWFSFWRLVGSSVSRIWEVMLQWLAGSVFILHPPGAHCFSTGLQRLVLKYFSYFLLTFSLSLFFSTPIICSLHVLDWFKSFSFFPLFPLPFCIFALFSIKFLPLFFFLTLLLGFLCSIICLISKSYILFPESSFFNRILSLYCGYHIFFYHSKRVLGETFYFFPLFPPGYSFWFEALLFGRVHFPSAYPWGPEMKVW